MLGVLDLFAAAGSATEGLLDLENGLFEARVLVLDALVAANVVGWSCALDAALVASRAGAAAVGTDALEL